MVEPSRDGVVASCIYKTNTLPSLVQWKQLEVAVRGDAKCFPTRIGHNPFFAGGQKTNESKSLLRQRRKQERRYGVLLRAERSWAGGHSWSGRCTPLAGS